MTVQSDSSDIPGQSNSFDETMQLKQVVLYVEGQQHETANEICLSIIKKNPASKMALDLLVENAHLGNIVSDAFRGLIGITSELADRPPEEMLTTCKNLLGEEAFQTSRIDRFLEKMAPYELIKRNLYEPGLYAQYAFLLDLLGQESKASLVRLTGKVFQQIAASTGEVNMLHEIRADQFAQNGTVSENDSDWICFVAGIQHVRLRKISHAVRKSGKKVRLFARSESPLAPEQMVEFDEVIYFQSPFDLFEQADKFGNQAVHVFFAADDGFLEAAIMLLLRPTSVVFDSYDLALEEMSPLSRLEENSEPWLRARSNASIHRFLFNHTPAICGRAAYAKIHKTRLPNAERQKRIYCPELAWGRKLSRSKLSAEDGKLHLAHGGTFLVENAYESRWTFFKTLAEKAEELDVHFHLYPMAWGNSDMSMYEEIEEKSEFFHIHQSLPYEQWLDELQIYDVGLYHIMAEDPTLEGTTPRNIDCSGSWANKVGDYLDAELYTLPMPAAKSIVFVTERYGIGQRGPIDRIFTKPFWDEMRHKILDVGVDFSTAKKALTMDSQGDRLIKFYDAVSASRKLFSSH